MGGGEEMRNKKQMCDVCAGVGCMEQRLHHITQHTHTHNTTQAPLFMVYICHWYTTKYIYTPLTYTSTPTHHQYAYPINTYTPSTMHKAYLQHGHARPIQFPQLAILEQHHQQPKHILLKLNVCQQQPCQEIHTLCVVCIMVV